MTGKAEQLGGSPILPCSARHDWPVRASPPYRPVFPLRVKTMTDLMKCGRCGKIGSKEKSVKMDGVWYGPECKKRILANVGESLEDFIKRQLGSE